MPMLFMDADTPIEDLVAQAQAHPVDLTLEDVHLVKAPLAASDEVYSPQLLPYKEWVATRPVGEEGERGLFEAGALNVLDEDVRNAAIYETSSRFAFEGVDDNGHPIVETTSLAADPNNPESVSLSGIIGVRQDADGFAIVEVDLHEYKNRLGAKVSNLVVVLPRSIGGIPVVRISGGAFRARLVNGIGVRLVVTPEGTLEVGRDAFSPLAVNNVHISQNVRQIEPQEFNAKTATVRADSISFHVDSRNRHFESRDGSLYSKDGKTLLFQAFPYERDLVLPEGLERIAQGAFVRNTPGPEIVICPETLERVDSKPSPDRLWDPDTLWVCEEGSRLHEALTARYPLAITPNFVRDDRGFYYDIVASGEAHLARSPRSCERVVLPGNVDGHPLVRIREGSLPKRLSGLVIPPTVRTIEKNNLCTGLEELVLPDGIVEVGESCFRSRKIAGTLRIPRSLVRIGRGCFEAALCHFEACGVTVRISPNLQLSAFTGEPDENGVPFDFTAYDAYLVSNHHVPDRAEAVLLRLQCPYKLSDEAKEALVSWLRANEEKAIERIGRIGDPQLLDALCDAGFITEETIDRQAEMLRQAHKTDGVLFLMSYRQKHFGAAAKQTSHDRFAL